MQRLRYLRKDMRNNWDLYLLAIPLVVYYVIFCYGPMYGLQIAFMDYNPWKGMEGSTYAGLKHFRNFLSLSTSFDYIINTLRISLCSLIFSLIHFFLLGIPALFVMGLTFQVIYLVRRNLLSAMLMHSVVNLAACAEALWFPEVASLF